MHPERVEDGSGNGHAARASVQNRGKTASLPTACVAVRDDDLHVVDTLARRRSTTVARLEEVLAANGAVVPCAHTVVRHRSAATARARGGDSAGAPLYASVALAARTVLLHAAAPPQYTRRTHAQA
ncbi:hypothetical protein ABL78_8285 [Leptomonas seymouri]|uniref:Uncharacterized protein n=1 Tax=Leptomonas seymouri TaxID=5684 RepID=A0A0N1IH75_LEPSE|nr:hypothetical protein ABL78_8285 [Leptomonas seymouri]|eukprot:KPI82700.1 hypothetical protein ABL78_8285 [Leptomonas seymouri]